MSGNHLNDLSKIYLDKVYKNNTETAEADKSRWEDLGGPTPDNYRSDDNSAKLKEDYETTKKREVLAAFKKDPKVRKRFEKAAQKEGGPGSAKNRAADDMLQTAKDIVKRKGDTSKSDDRYAYEGFSNWRQDLVEQDLIEIVDGPEDKVEKKVKEKKVSNKIVINPKLSEAIEEIGGEVLELTEVEEKEDPKEDPALKSKEKKASMLKKQVLIKKLQAVRTGAEDITASYEPDIEGVIEYFYEEGINEEGFDQLIEEIGLEEFVDFVEGGVVELNEERAARRASVRAPSYEKVKAKVDAADAAKKKAKKGEYATSYAKKETDVTVYDDKPAAKKKAPAKKTVVKKAAPKPAPKKVAKKDYDGDGKKEAPKAEHRGVRNKAITKAVAKVKKTQPVKKATKQGLGDKIRGAYKAGVKRHRKATQGARVFGKGFAAGAKKAVKFAKDVKKVVSEEELDERLGGKGYKPYTSLMGKKVSGDWEDSDRGAGNKATRRAGGKVKKKSPTYQAYVLNKEEVVSEGKTFDAWKKAAAKALGRKKEEKKAEKAQDAGAKARRMLKRREHAKYVSGSTENVPDEMRD